ncbi:MAG: hypothetical protein HC890_07550 [Chloroflexaceae bacterium]|nr:hypothetical protein [Chloroflexaceae bacterium]
MKIFFQHPLLSALTQDRVAQGLDFTRSPLIPQAASSKSRKTSNVFGQ